VWDCLTANGGLIASEEQVDKWQMSHGGEIAVQVAPYDAAMACGAVTEFVPLRVLAHTWEVPALGVLPALLGTTMRFALVATGRP
jgi:hypothetical protein